MASINQNRTPLSLPDFCNLGILSRVLLGAIGLCFAAALLRHPGAAGLGNDFLAITALTAPTLLGSLALLCWTRRWLVRLDYGVGLVATALIVQGVAFLGHALLHQLSGGDAPALWQVQLHALLFSAVLLFYLHLRARALSPAIAEARLQALQARIRPHFLFNSITAVLSLIRDEPKQAETALEDLADLFRVLMADNRELAPIADEITLCRQYLALEQLRLGDRLRVAWHVDKMPPDALIPPLVLQPLLENAVYHGIEPASLPGEVSINIYRNRSQLYAVLRNPYHTDGGSHHAGNKMALANIRERLALHFDMEARLDTKITGGSYQVTIVLPYVTAGQARH